MGCFWLPSVCRKASLSVEMDEVWACVRAHV